MNLPLGIYLRTISLYLLLIIGISFITPLSADAYAQEESELFSDEIELDKEIKDEDRMAADEYDDEVMEKDSPYTPPSTAPKSCNVCDVTHFGAKSNDNSDDTGAISAAQNALPESGGTLYFPNGTYLVKIITIKKSNIKFKGQDNRLSVLKSNSTNGHILASSSSHVIKNVTIENLGFENGKIQLQLHSNNIKGRTIIRNNYFFNTGTIAVNLIGMSNILIENNEFQGNGRGKGTGILVGNSSTTQGAISSKVDIFRNRFVYLNRGVVVASNNENNVAVYKANNIRISYNYFDLAWWLLKEVHANEGSAVSYKAAPLPQPYSNIVPVPSPTPAPGYKAHTLTDTSVNFKKFNPKLQTYYKQNVRIMPLKQSGRASYTSRTIVDSKARFLTHKVKSGDILRSGGYFAVVSKVNSETSLEIEEWLSDADRLSRHTPPAERQEYRIYGLVVGTIQAYDEHSIYFSTPKSSPGWKNFDGKKSIPAAGTRYEILHPRPSYNILVDGGIGIRNRDESLISNVVVAKNTIRRGWADQVGVYVNKAIINENIIEDGQDTGLTVMGNNHMVALNTVRHNGAMGMYIETTDSRVEKNTLIYNQWMNTYDGSLGDIVMRRAINNIVRANTCTRPAELPADEYVGLGFHGIVLWSTHSNYNIGQTRGNQILANKCEGHNIYDIRLRQDGSGIVRGNTIRANTGIIYVPANVTGNRIYP